MVCHSHSIFSDQVDIHALLEWLGHRQICSLLVEGGADLMGAFFQTKRIQEVHVYLAPMIIGGKNAPGAVGGNGFAKLADALQLKNNTVKKLGKDLLITAFSG